MTGQDVSASSETAPEMWVCHLGTVGYSQALSLQERIDVEKTAANGS